MNKKISYTEESRNNVDNSYTKDNRLQDGGEMDEALIDEEVINQVVDDLSHITKPGQRDGVVIADIDESDDNEMIEG